MVGVVDEDVVAAVRGPEGNLGYLFRLGHQSFRAAIADALALHQLSPPQYGALSAFDAVPELSSAELARLTAVTPQTMNTLVHQLLERELLTRRPHPTHGKVVILQLSEQGRRILDRATPAVRAVEHTALTGLTQRETRIVTTWLAELTSRFA